LRGINFILSIHKSFKDLLWSLQKTISTWKCSKENFLHHSFLEQINQFITFDVEVLYPIWLHNFDFHHLNPTKIHFMAWDKIEMMLFLKILQRKITLDLKGLPRDHVGPCLQVKSLDFLLLIHPKEEPL